MLEWNALPLWVAHFFSNTMSYDSVIDRDMTSEDDFFVLSGAVLPFL